MATVKSIVRNILKPILFKMLDEKTYLWFQYHAKIRDIDKRLVEEDEAELLPYFVKNDSVALDLGANYGYYTVPMARLCPKGTVYAFEPIPPTFHVLKKITEHYRLENVKLLEQGVGEKNASVQFEVPIQDAGFVSAGQAHIKGRHNEVPEKRIYYPWSENRTYECKVISIDQEFPSLEKLDFVKIDIEGAELYAFKGMVNTLNRFHPVILVEICKFWLTGFGVTADEFSDFITGLDYDFYHYDKTHKRLVKVPSLFDDPRYNFIDDKNMTPFAPNYVLIHRSQSERFGQLISPI